MAAGPNSVIEAVNSSFAIYNKDGGTIAAPMDFFTFFHITPSDQVVVTNPALTYDELAGRFVISTLEIHDSSDPALQKSFIDFAVSDTSNPQSAADFHEIHDAQFSPLEVTERNLATGAKKWGDYPKLGWNADAYVFTVNMFDFPV